MIRGINTGWEYVPDWSQEFLNFEGSGEQVELPHNPVELPLHYADSDAYQHVCGYRRILNFPNGSIGRRIYLRFDGAAHIATLYVNGTEVGTHGCGYTAFQPDITKYIVPGDNRIAVKLDMTENPSVPPFGNVVDYLTYGGLYREAWLIEKPMNHIKDVFVATPSVDSVEVTVETAARYSGEYLITVLTPSGEQLWETRTRKGKAVSPHLPVRAWRPEDPCRYICRVRLVDGNRIEDTERVIFGFRTAEFREAGFYLNGERYFLRGLNRHQSYPYLGYAAPESLQREDARILKEELGCNAVRTSHYPQSRYFIDECDRLGILVFMEIPGWQHIGNASWKEQACRNVEEMILQYRNHPSIILWGVRINESADDDSFYRQTNKLAHKLDPSRCTSGVRYLEKSKLLEDVYAFNDFSYNGTGPACRPKKRVTPSVEKAFLISEHTGHMFPTKSFDPWQKRQDHAMRHMHILNAAYADDEHAGCFGWCMFDYQTHKDFGSGDRICYHGVMDAFRNPKPAAYAYASQQDSDIVLEAASAMDIGDYAAGQRRDVAVFSNAEEVHLYKNGMFVCRLERSEESALPHPPFLMTDTIGTLLETQEGFPEKKAALVRECLDAAADYGISGMPLKYKLKLVWGFLRYHISYKEAVSLYSRYIQNWGAESIEWRFDAMVRGKCVKSIVRAPSAQLHMAVYPSSLSLTVFETYDMAAVRVRLLDGSNCIASYAQLPVSFRAEGAINLVGPEMACAEGGMCGCYVRTNALEGEGRLYVSAPGMDSAVLVFHVERKQPFCPDEPTFLSEDESPVLNAGVKSAETPEAEEFDGSPDSPDVIDVEAEPAEQSANESAESAPELASAAELASAGNGADGTLS